MGVFTLKIKKHMIKLFLTIAELPADYVGKAIILDKSYQIIQTFEFTRNHYMTFSVSTEYKTGFARRE